jgi:putative ATPase
MPDNLRGRRYYHPTNEGREKLLAQRLEEIRRARDAGRKTQHSGDDETGS